MSEIENNRKEAQAVARLVYNDGRFLISVPKAYTPDLAAIKSKRVLITVRELV